FEKRVDEDSCAWPEVPGLHDGSGYYSSASGVSTAAGGFSAASSIPHCTTQAGPAEDASMVFTPQPSQAFALQLVGEAGAGASRTKHLATNAATPAAENNGPGCESDPEEPLPRRLSFSKAHKDVQERDDDEELNKGVPEMLPAEQRQREAEEYQAMHKKSEERLAAEELHLEGEQWRCEAEECEAIQRQDHERFVAEQLRLQQEQWKREAEEYETLQKREDERLAAEQLHLQEEQWQFEVQECEAMQKQEEECLASEQLRLHEEQWKREAEECKAMQKQGHAQQEGPREHESEECEAMQKQEQEHLAAKQLRVQQEQQQQREEIRLAAEHLRLRGEQWKREAMQKQ
ncbi:unnamed protein product, partial [Polarella glacialis]